MADPENVDIPETVITELDDCTDKQLREIITYARHLLKERRTRSSEIEPRDEHEEIVSIEKKDGHSLVVINDERRPDVHVLYRVSYETKPDGEGVYNWEYLGPVNE